ncbi:hypothetical protein PR202_gb21052 [Eleusine coracana subsp. coracana]|uniref:Pyruvate, phosphate dikinase regulatory protein, chloroplastic n=1 Tax=Eleusine coracana subsp. coracana TaxID=191504 RepID=A0AAV5FCC0_ELECO|nr:hypothetical protein PR202_gb21052 [Eleusine coracana subsp. coracana]
MFSSSRPNPRRATDKQPARHAKSLRKRREILVATRHRLQASRHRHKGLIISTLPSHARTARVPALLRSQLALDSAMIGGATNPFAAPPLLPPSPGRRVAAGPGPLACVADPAALSPAAESPPAAHEDSTGSAQPPEQASPALPHLPSSSPTPTLRASSQLTRFSRARALRSGRRLTRTALSSAPVTTTPPPPAPMPSLPDGLPMAGDDEDDDVCIAETDAATGKSIYLVSDGTGETAEHSVKAALGQFEHCLVDQRCTVNTHLFSGVSISSRPLSLWKVDDTDRLVEIIKQAAKEGAVVLYTLVDPSMAEAMKKACNIWGVPSTDVLRPTVDAIASHIGVAPSGIPRSSPSRKAQLSEDYFRRIEAIDFTIKQDDGAQPENLNRAHIVLVGVSRTGKTPLSIYLAQKGYKVANVPIVMGVNLPKSLFEINQDKIFALTINPVILQAIRKTRAKTLGFDGYQSNYAEMDHVRHELVHANKIFAQNPGWPVIEVTGKAIEETAAIVVRIHHDRKQKCSMPRISKRY